MGFLEDILTYAVKNGASDVHLTVGSPPAVRVDGTIRFLRGEALTPKDTTGFLDELLTPPQRDRFENSGDFDLAHSISGLGRFRVNILRQRGSVGIVMRHVRSKILDFASLHLPESMEIISQMPRGLVLVTGTTGSGKSTTLASLIDRINEMRRCHIVTIEDPIEYLHVNKKSIITQREVGLDTKDFSTSLRAAMREDPDVILIGEMRDQETFGAAMAAAETGHLVFSTLHTTNAMMTVDRIIDLFPSNQHDQIRSQLSLQVRALVAQRLLVTTDGKGRVPAIEVMFNNPAIAALIRDNNVKQIPSAIAAGKEDGMQTFNMSLLGLVRQGLISEDEALWASDSPEALSGNLRGFTFQSDRGGILRRK
jgi:twitching motility protein PilT